jgi:RimJ/RimL family protein N-acetyltransferase
VPASPDLLSPTYPITTERLVLRPFTEDDLDALYDIRKREDVNRYLYTDPLSLDQARDELGKLTKLTTIQQEGDMLLLAVTLPGSADSESDTLIGDVILHWRNAEHRKGEIGYLLHPDHFGHGYAAEAARAMLRLGFEKLGLHRVVGSCDARNTASARVLEKLGMRREAHLVENEIVKGVWTDELSYALLATEWQAAVDS